MAQEARTSPLPTVRVLDDSKPHEFVVPTKEIHNGDDLSSFLMSQAYRNITVFLMQLNHAMFPVLSSDDHPSEKNVQTFPMGAPEIKYSGTTYQLRELLKALDLLIDEVPLDKGPRRFGNVSFRKWSEILETRATALLEAHLPPAVTGFKHEDVTPLDEIRPYFLGSFGSPQRLDFGTGHELSFLAFLCCIWKLGGFGSDASEDDLREIVLGVIQPYLSLVRRLIQTYTLEPAGSHGVWGLDDHSFLPYIFGSAQYGPPIKPEDPTPLEGSLAGAPAPGNVAQRSLVDKERDKNMYFAAIGFIYDVKKGPFWEHSPTLYDISGVRAGWGKINKGMMKMYDAEVLGKLPVVQHFPFGSLFSWDRDPNARPPATTAHAFHQPKVGNSKPASATTAPSPIAAPLRAPWAAGNSASAPETYGRFAQRRNVSHNAAVGIEIPVSEEHQADRNAQTNASNAVPPLSRAPWAK